MISKLDVFIDISFNIGPIASKDSLTCAEYLSHARCHQYGGNSIKHLMPYLFSVHTLGAHPLGGFSHLLVVRFNGAIDSEIAEYDHEHWEEKGEEVHA